MMNREWITQALFCLPLIGSMAVSVVVAAEAGTAAPNDDTPHIIIVMADDMEFSDLGCYGGEIKTPTIDRLAAEGLRFSQFYNCAVCGPSRASLMTVRQAMCT